MIAQKSITFPDVTDDTVLMIDDIVETIEVMINAGRNEDAVEVCRWAFSDPGEKPARLHYARGMAFAAIGALQPAIGSLHTAALQRPNDGHILINLALLLLRANLINEAKTILQRVLDHCPDYRDSAISLKMRLEEALLQWGYPQE